MYTSRALVELVLEGATSEFGFNGLKLLNNSHSSIKFSFE